MQENKTADRVFIPLISDLGVSWFSLALYAMFVPLFAMAGIEKIMNPVPDWFLKKFESTLFNAFAGQLDYSFYAIAMMELFTASMFVMSILRGEFLADRGSSFLRAGLICAMVTFAMLAFGMRVAQDYNGAYQLFVYFSLTALLSATTRLRSVV